MKKDRFGRDQAPVVRQWGWRVLTCTVCSVRVDVFEVPAAFLDEPFWGGFRCGLCAALATRELEKAAA